MIKIGVRALSVVLMLAVLSADWPPGAESSDLTRLQQNLYLGHIYTPHDHCCFDISYNHRNHTARVNSMPDMSGHTVIIIDVSSSMRRQKLKNKEARPFEMLKHVARDLCREILGGGGDNQVAIVTFHRKPPVLASDFVGPGGLNGLLELINELEPDSWIPRDTNMDRAIISTDAFFDGVTAENKNIILLTDGLPNLILKGKKKKDYEGGRFVKDEYKYYREANATLETFKSFHPTDSSPEKYNIYPIGFVGRIEITRSEELRARDYGFVKSFLDEITWPKGVPPPVTPTPPPQQGG
jgi:hypothetical protein